MPALLPLDTRADQCERAADYMEAHPGCALRDLAAGADLGSASKVVSEMVRTYGYGVWRVRVRVRCRDGVHSRCVMRYWLDARPSHSQPDLFSTT